MAVSKIKLWMTFCCSYMIHYHTVLGVVESKKLEQGQYLLVMSMEQTGNRANVLTTFLVAGFKKGSFNPANSFVFHCLVKSNESLSSFKFFYCYLDLWEGW